MKKLKKKKKQEDDYFDFVDEKPAPAEKKEKPPPAPGEWPDDVPVLSADNVAWAGDRGPEGRRSVDWWLYWTFTHIPPRKGKYLDDRVDAELRDVMGERFGKPIKCLGTFLLQSSQRKQPSLAWYAACWNECMRRLGYEIPQKSCKDPGM